MADAVRDGHLEGVLRLCIGAEAVIAETLERTARLLIPHDEADDAGVAAALAAAVYEEGFWLLDGPIGWLNSPTTSMPAAALDDAYCVTAEEIERAMLCVLEP